MEIGIAKMLKYLNAIKAKLSLGRKREKPECGVLALHMIRVTLVIYHFLNASHSFLLSLVLFYLKIPNF